MKLVMYELRNLINECKRFQSENPQLKTNMYCKL